MIRIILLSLALTACSSLPGGKKKPSEKVLSFVHAFNIPTSYTYKNEKFGGLSGIVKVSDSKWLVLSDDRGDFSPARYYEMSFYHKDGSWNYQIKNRKYLRDSNNKRFKKGSIDLEGIAIYPKGVLGKDKLMVVSTEGDDRLSPIVQPKILFYNPQGRMVKSITAPADFQIPKDKNKTTGIRPNLSLETLTVAKQTSGEAPVFVMNESALYQDGEKSTGKAGAKLRILKILPKSEKTETFFYPLSSIPNLHNFEKVDGMVGVSDALALNGGHELIVIERAFIRNNYENVIKLFKVDLRQRDSQGIVKKELIMDLHQIIPLMPEGYKKLDNIEGIAWGPKLADGRDSLVLVADNNFSKHQRTLIILLAIEKPL